MILNIKKDIEESFSLLNKECIKPPEKYIDIKTHDGLIDLSPCIGIYQEAMFFENYDINKEIDLIRSLNRDEKINISKRWKLEKKILHLVAFEVKQKRYALQVSLPFITEDQKSAISERLETRFSPNEKIQEECDITFYDCHGKLAFKAKGRCDVIKKHAVYELKFVNELTHEHYLQCACYMVALNLKRGYLWNVKNNEIYLITIPNKKDFLNAVAKTVSKGELKKYYSKKM